MRIVPNLKDLNECPNCGDDRSLRETEDQFGRPYLTCLNCHEEIYENETTCSFYHIKKFAETKEEWLKQKQKRKEDFIFEMREEISNLTWSIHDSKTQILVENIQNIFNRIIDYIEEN
jgi:RNA polymerase subunit RPABC4/transcription elongation factor Spt4